MKKNVSTYLKGDILEEKTFEILKELLEDERFYVSGKGSKIYRKKNYFSNDRQANIVFDLAIETFMPGSEEYSLLTLIECKNYANSVQVNDVESFSDKIHQVGGHKGVMVTTSPFQKSALKIAITRKITVIRVNSDNSVEWINRRTDNTNLQGNIEEFEENMTCEEGTGSPVVGRYESFVFSAFQDLLIYFSIIDQYYPSTKDLKIKYQSDEDIENRINEMSLASCYDGFNLNIDRLCIRMSELYDVNFIVNEQLGSINNSPAIGKIVYNPLTIYIHPGLRSDIARFRFTVAHEIGHLVLHSFLLSKYYGITADTENMQSASYVFSSEAQRRLETQANRFAAILLMPTPYLKKVVSTYFTRENIAQRGFIFLDHQKDNQVAVYKLLSELQVIFGVSKDVAKYRLKDLGLLKDAQDGSIRNHLRNLDINVLAKQPSRKTTPF